MKVYVVRMGEWDNFGVGRVTATRELAEAWIESQKICPHLPGHHPPPQLPQYTLDVCIAAVRSRIENETEIEEWDVDEEPTP